MKTKGLVASVGIEQQLSKICHAFLTRLTHPTLIKLK